MFAISQSIPIFVAFLQGIGSITGDVCSKMNKKGNPEMENIIVALVLVEK